MISTGEWRKRFRQPAAPGAARLTSYTARESVLRLGRLLRVRRALARAEYDIDKRLPTVADELAREIGGGWPGTLAGARD